jgi:hypothetical protein
MESITRNVGSSSVGHEQAFFAVFPRRSRESSRCLWTMTEASFPDIDPGRTTAVARRPDVRWCERGDRAGRAKRKSGRCAEWDYSLFRGHDERPRSTYADVCHEIIGPNFGTGGVC